jgi:hypothetical protein
MAAVKSSSVMFRNPTSSASNESTCSTSVVTCARNTAPTFWVPSMIVPASGTLRATARAAVLRE